MVKACHIQNLVMIYIFSLTKTVVSSIGSSDM